MRKPHAGRLVPLVGGPLDGGACERLGIRDGAEVVFREYRRAGGRAFCRLYFYRFSADPPRCRYLRTEADPAATSSKT